MARVTVWLFIESAEIETTQLSVRIGIPSDRSWKKGDQRGKTDKTFDTNSWAIESRSEVEDNPLALGEKMQSCLADVLGRIAKHADRFRSVATGQIAGLYIGISSEAAPALEFEAATIKAIDALGVDVEIDLMIYDKS
jgi:Domain of unknown function (DUF4279)